MDIGWWRRGTVRIPGALRPGDIVPQVMGGMDGTGGVPPLRIIDEVAGTAGGGEKWAGDDLKAGLELVGVLASDPVADAIVKIDVSNYSGRVNPRKAHVGLDYQVQYADSLGPAGGR